MSNKKINALTLPNVTGSVLLPLPGAGYVSVLFRADGLVYRLPDGSEYTVAGTIVPPADPKLLDFYPDAAFAFSTRKLRAGYEGPLLRLRRTSDSTELDIGADSNGDLDTAAASAFVGASDGIVVTWYDQSGNGGNATEDSVGQGPRLYLAGVLQVSGVLSKPSPQFSAINNMSIASATVRALFANCPAISYAAAYQTDATINQVIFSINEGDSNTSSRCALYHDSSNRVNLIYNRLDSTTAGIITSTDTFAAGTQRFVWGDADFTNNSSGIYVNDTVRASGTTGTAGITDATSPLDIDIGHRGGAFDFNGNISEIIAWPADLIADRSGVYADQVAHFSV